MVAMADKVASKLEEKKGSFTEDEVMKHLSFSLFHWCYPFETNGYFGCYNMVERRVGVAEGALYCIL